MIYQLLRVIVRITLRVFFRKIVIQKKEELPTKGPLIVVVNHPNTFMDPIIVASLFKQQVGFLGNASIFVHKVVNTIFEYFHVIRVYRQKDVPEGEKPDNSRSFRDSHKYLGKGNTLLIFPEGNSYHELKLRKIKTGAARIAFGAEEAHDFQLGIRIIPIGLYYSNPKRFRSKLYINVGLPFALKSFISDYQDDPLVGVQALTDRIKKELEANVIANEDDEQEELFMKIKRIYKRRLLENFKQANDAYEEFRLTKELSKAIHYFKISYPDKYQEIKHKVERYIEIMHQMDLKNGSLKSYYSSMRKLSVSVAGLLYAIGGFPVYLFGLIQNYLPYKLPYWIARSITKEIEYHAPIMMTLGIIVFPSFYLAYGLLVYNNVTSNTWWLSLYLLLLPITGFYVLHYFTFLRNIGDFLKINPLFKSNNHLVKELSDLKIRITEELDEARTSYLKRL